MANIVFYVSVIVAVVSMITANVIMLRYMHTHLRSVTDVQDKFIETFNTMELAHQTTFEALRATEDTLKSITADLQQHKEELSRLSDDLSQLGEHTCAISTELTGIKSDKSHIDDLK